MNIGKLVRMNRLFSHTSGRLCSVAIDHYIGYGNSGNKLPDGLHYLPSTLKEIVKGKPDAITMQKGIVISAWQSHAGKIPLIIQSSIGSVDDVAGQQLLTPEEAIRLGADAIAVATFVRGPTEAEHLRIAADYVREASRFELPVICHIYPRVFTENGVENSYTPEDIAWAAHCAFEIGVDIIKVPYCGDRSAYADIIANIPTPIVAAGGPRQETLEMALTTMYDVVQSGAKGAAIGRNVWGFPHISAAIKAFKAVIHDGMSPKDALQVAGL